MNRGLLDTSAVIRIGELTDGELPEECVISAVTLAELTVGPLATDDPQERATRQGHLQFAEANFAALPFDDQAARAYGRVAAAFRASGRKSTARSYDALIAATALAAGLPVFTCNPGDFRCINGLSVHAVGQ